MSARGGAPRGRSGRPWRVVSWILSTGLAVLPAGLAGAQGPGSSPPSVIANPGMLSHDLDVYANAEKICWTRGEPVSVDWLAERDAGYRRGPFSRYYLSELEDGWQWVRRDASRGSDLAAEGPVVRGIPYTRLEVHAAGAEHGRAAYSIDSDLSSGEVVFEWTAPPARICMADGLRLHASAAIAAGAPGARRVGFILPLTPEQRLVEGPEVKACSPQSTTGVDSEIGFDRDEGLCQRTLYHLPPQGEWALWVNLPESFYVIYSYVPERREQ